MYIEEANKLLETGYLPLETGYIPLPNGQWLIAALTRMPGVTGKMLDWWMGSYLNSSEDTGCGTAIISVLIGTRIKIGSS